MNNHKIIVNQSIDIQRHVLKIAAEKTDDEIINVIKSLQSNKSHGNNNKNGAYLKVWHAYSNGWRGNFVAVEPKIGDTSSAVVASVSVAKKDTASVTNPIIRKPISLAYEKPTDLDVANKFISLAGNASARRKEFSLTLVDVRRLLTKKRCEYTGVELTRATTALPNATDRTIDRLDADAGYIQGNVFAVSHHANSLKNELFEKETEHKTTVELMHEMTSRIIKLKNGAFEANESE